MKEIERRRRRREEMRERRSIDEKEGVRGGAEEVKGETNRSKKTQR